MRQAVEQEQLGFVATVRPDGTSAFKAKFSCPCVIPLASRQRRRCPRSCHLGREIARRALDCAGAGTWAVPVEATRPDNRSRPCSAALRRVRWARGWFPAAFRFLDQGSTQVSSLMIGVGWPLRSRPSTLTSGPPITMSVCRLATLSPRASRSCAFLPAAASNAPGKAWP